MTIIEETTCSECGSKAEMVTENNRVISVTCGFCGYIFDCPIENQGDDDTAWDSYPDGWTCQSCGETYAGILPAEVKDGTTCGDCIK